MLKRIALLAAAFLLMIVASAGAVVNNNCPVNASTGYVGCISLANPNGEVVKAWHASGLQYKWQLVRPSDGGRWGAWTYNDLSYHAFTLSLSGTIVGQVDNQGSGNPSAYYAEMI